MTEEVTTTEEITQDPPSDNGLLSVDEFAEKIKAKYSQYKDMDNLELTNKIIAKYPSYKDQVNISGQVEKKKSNRYFFKWGRGSYGIHYRNGNKSWLFGFFTGKR